MASDADQQELPRSPLAPEEEEAVLPWWTPLLTMAAFVVAKIALAAVVYPVLHPNSVYHPRYPLGHYLWWLLGDPAWVGLRIGLGVVVADRVVGGRWSRAVRWSLGMALASCVLRPDRLYGYVAGLAYLGPQVVFSSLSLFGFYGAWEWVSGPLGAALLGLWLGWAAKERRGRWHQWMLVGLDARLIWGLVVFLPWLRWRAPLETHYVWQKLARDLFWDCLAGALIGLAFWLALTIGERRRKGSGR